MTPAERSTLSRVAAALEGLAVELRELALDVVEAGPVVHAAATADGWRSMCDGRIYPADVGARGAVSSTVSARRVRVTCGACVQAMEAAEVAAERRGAQVREALQ